MPAQVLFYRQDFARLYRRYLYLGFKYIMVNTADSIEGAEAAIVNDAVVTGTMLALLETGDAYWSACQGREAFSSCWRRPG